MYGQKVEGKEGLERGKERMRETRRKEEGKEGCEGDDKRESTAGRKGDESKRERRKKE